MSLTVQNLRAVGTGVEPTSLLPGQIAFNITDKVLYVGDGSNFKTDFEGNQSSGVPGEGWYAMPMDFDALGNYYVANPAVYGDVPTDQQVLTWDTGLGHPIWTSSGGGGGSFVYVTSNGAVAGAPGATTSAKISAAIGIVSPDEGNVAIVTGLPDDVYEGLYFFTTEWVKGAAYAYPSASEVIYNNTGRTIGATVQLAINDLDDGLIATTAIANTANSTANSALSIASAALPRAGGTMTGTLVSRDIDVQSGYSIDFNGGANGSQDGISDSLVLISSTTAASSTALKSAYDLANAALARSGGSMSGAITFAPGQVFPVSGIQDATGAQKGIVQIGSNIQDAAGVISVLDSSTGNKGVVQLFDGVTSNSSTLALTANQGLVLQGQIDSLTLASNVTLAGSLDASSGLIDSVTTQGAATVPPFTAGAGLPAAAAGNADYYVLVTIAGSYNPPGGGGPYLAEPGDWFLSNGTAWQYLGVGARPQSATYVTAGIVQLANTAVTYTGTSDTEAVTPNSLQDKLSDSTSLADSNRIASSVAVKSAYDLANAALPAAGGTMTGNITFQDPGEGVVFNGGSQIFAVSDSVSTTSSTTGASSTAVKSAYDLANSALQRAGGTMTGAITFVAGQTFPISGIQDATTGQKGVVQIGTNIDVSSGTISVATATTAVKGLVQVGSNVQVAAGTISVLSGTTAQPGVVQLNDTTSSTSTTQALTANQGYNLQQQINNLSVSNNLTFAGTIDGSTGFMITVSAEGAAKGFVIGSAMPSPAPANSEYFTVVTVPGTMTPPGGSAQAVNDGDYWLSDGIVYNYLPIGYSAPYASTTSCGVVVLATNAQTQTGVNTTAVVVPSALQSKVSDSVSTTSSACIASSTAVKSAYDLANAAVPKSCYTALGALTAGTGAGTVGTLSIGTTGQFLAANTGCATGLEWCTASLACVPCSAFTAKGDLLTGTGASTFTALPSGTAGQFLTIDTACAGNMKWVTAQGATLCGFTCTATPFSTALGSLAGASLSALSVANTAIGYAALDSEASGDFNVAIGHNALTAQNGPTGNTAVGGNAGAAIVGGACNTIMGYNAADALTTGSNNVAIGMNSLSATISGGNNTAVGMNALAVSTVGCQTAVGYCALASATTGVQNTGLGYFALSSISAGSQSTAVGFGAGQSTSGGGNTYVGYNAGNAITTGVENTFLGSGAGSASVTTLCSVAIGRNALLGIHTGQGTVAIGASALQSLTSGTLNTAVGFQAGLVLSSNGNNTFLGTCAGRSQTSSNNTAVGACALFNSGVNNNTGVGFNAGAALTTGGSNTFVGAAAGDNATTADNSVAIGYNALGAAHTIGGTVAVGVNALAAATSGACNVAVGLNAGSAVTTGSCNVLVGRSAGSSITTGGCNVILGSYAGTTALANNVVLSDGAGNIKLQVNENGAVGVGTTPSYGTTGQILVSAGTGAAPTWTTSAAVPANYGSFLRTTTQTNADTTNGNAVTFDTTVASNNFSVVSGTQITAAVAGTYSIVATYQVSKTNAGTDDVNVWFKKNGANVANSAFNLTLVGNNAAQLATTPWIITLAAGDQIEAWWYSADANAILLGEPAAAPYPAIPSVNLVIMPVGA